MDTELRRGKRLVWTMGLAKRTCRGAAPRCVCTCRGVTVTLRGGTLGDVALTLRGGTLGGVALTLRGGTLEGVPVTLRDCRRVADSCRRARFKGVAVGLNGGAGPFCVMAWMRSSTGAAVRLEGVTCGMVYVEGKKAALLLLRHVLVASMYMR